MDGTRFPDKAVGGIAQGEYFYPNLKREFAQELISDLMGFHEKVEKGEVSQMDYLTFCLQHLRKIDEFIEFNWT